MGRTPLSAGRAQEIAAGEIGPRAPLGLAGRLMFAVALCWSLFQVFVASEFPFWLSALTGLNIVLNSTETRIWHLAFAIVLSTLAYPLFKRAPRSRIPVYDWTLLAAGCYACLYLLYYKDDIAGRAGLPTTGDYVAASVGISVLGISAYRTLGLPMLVVAGVFFLYVFFGHLEFLPEVVQWKGASAGKALWHYWIQTEGVFGIALGISASVIFLFVLFGALLEKAGAGNYFVELAFALLGHMRGGPAKAAVAASAMSGIYSGSSIANVVTTGTFTIPLMKRAGLSPEKAGAVEVASSTNGQLTPPVMGAAAFLIAEFVGISYTDVIRHALLPAAISYMALVYIVHLEAVKLGLRGLDKPPPLHPFLRRAAGFLGGFLGVLALGAFVHYVLGAVRNVFPGATLLGGVAAFAAAYLVLLRMAAKHSDLAVRDPDTPFDRLPRVWPVAVTGFHFLLPVIVLLWCVLLERLSPSLSAFWAVVAMAVVVLTQHPLKAYFRGGRLGGGEFLRGARELIDGMVAGARNMTSIGVATGVAGVIIGSISLTGAHQIVGEFIEFVSGGNLMLMLLLVAVMSLILGMGLPTTANYIVVSSLMAGVIVELGAQSGLVLPLIAVHLFVFYFGILADDTPPVGLAAFAASAISGGDPIRTGVQGFAYDIRTALLPFMFLFNTELLLINVGFLEGVFVFLTAAAAMMLFASATQGFLLARNKWWEGALLLLIALTLFRPGFWLDRMSPPLLTLPPAQIFEVAAVAPDDDVIRVRARGKQIGRDTVKTTTAILPLGSWPGAEEKDGFARLERNAGMSLRTEQDGQGRDRVYVEALEFGGAAELSGIDFDWEILSVEVPNEDRMYKQVFYIPALLLLAVVVWSQSSRRRRTQATA